MQTLTYGDFLTLPSVPGVLWRVTDIRSIEKAGSPFEDRAELRPWRPGPDAANPTEGATSWPYDEPVKIGRAERVGVEITLGMRPGPYDRASDTYGPSAFGAHATTRNYAAPLTDAQRATLEREAGDPFAFSFHLPPLTAEEVRERVAALIVSESNGREAARLTIGHAPNLYRLDNDHGGHNPVPLIRDAFDGPAGAEALADILDRATAAYRAALASNLRTFGALPEGVAL